MQPHLVRVPGEYAGANSRFSATQWLRYRQDGTVALELQYRLDGTRIYVLQCRLDGTVEIELPYRPMYIYA